MIIVDIILIIILAAFVMSGMRYGFIQTLGNFVGSILGFMGAQAWSPWFGGVMSKILPVKIGLAQVIAFIIIFIFIDRIVGILFKIADKLFKIVTMLPFISSINKLLGAILGLAEGIVLVGSSVYLILTFRLDPTLMAWFNGSTVASWTQQIFRNVLGFLL